MGALAAVVAFPLFMAVLHTAGASGLPQPMPRVFLTFEGKGASW